MGKADLGCPYCSGRKVLAGFNDLATTHPGHSGDVAPAHEQALEAHRRVGHKPQAAWWRGECGHVYKMAVRDRLAGLLPVLFGEEEAREADKARLALGPSARKERGASVLLLPIGASCEYWTGRLWWRL